MWKEFKEFAVRGNVIDMAVGIILGAAFTLLVQSMVADILMPPLSLLTEFSNYSEAYIVLEQGRTAGPYESLAQARESGATVLNYGNFFHNLVNFLLVSFAVFLLVRYVNRLSRPEPEPETPAPRQKRCPYCTSDIPQEATRCPLCTSRLEESA